MVFVNTETLFLQEEKSCSLTFAHVSRAYDPQVVVHCESYTRDLSKFDDDQFIHDFLTINHLQFYNLLIFQILNRLNLMMYRNKDVRHSQQFANFIR